MSRRLKRNDQLCRVLGCCNEALFICRPHYDALPPAIKTAMQDKGMAKVRARGMALKWFAAKAEEGPKTQRLPMHALPYKED